MPGLQLGTDQDDRARMAQQLRPQLQMPREEARIADIFGEVLHSRDSNRAIEPSYPSLNCLCGADTSVLPLDDR